jgi:hypothetical protein
MPIGFSGTYMKRWSGFPGRIAKDHQTGGDDGRLTSLLSRGSPVRYFLPGLPVMIGATVYVVLVEWRRPNSRPWLLSLATTVLSGIVATAWLVRAVNLKLFIAGQTLTAAEQDHLLHRWYRVNVFRLLTAAGSWLIAARLSSRLRSR